MSWTNSDGIGKIEVLEVFGNDLTVVNAARVSFAKESTEFTGRDAGLIRYLATHHHESPFFHPQIRLRVKMPIFVAREWFRHTVGFARNEVSRRYVDDRPACWSPVTGVRARNANLKQGSADHSVANENDVLSRWNDMQGKVVDFYEEMLAEGVAPEVARGILPQSMYTEFIETGSLYAYARLCQLRLHPQAQAEIRRYAAKIDACLESQFPVSWAALKAKWVLPEEPAPTVPSAQPASPEAQPASEVEPTQVPSVEQVNAEIQQKIESMSLESVGHGTGC